MSAYLRIALIFLFVGSLLGSLLRLHTIYPLPYLEYMNVLHGHSHIMFLGWVFNVIYIGYMELHIPAGKRGFFKAIFWILQALNLGMLVSFPLQGYGTYSIAFSTLHTLVSFVFIVQFFIVTKESKTYGSGVARLSLLACAASAAGPFALAFLMMNQLGDSPWYNYAIFYYLHFQYNGFFFFATISLWLNVFESFSHDAVLKRALILFLLSLVPTYFLSILYSSPGLLFNIVGLAGAVTQLIAFILVIKWFLLNRTAVRSKLGPVFGVGLIILVALGLKLGLQFLSAFPSFAKMAYEMRPLLIAYLHLFLLGVITVSILVFLDRRGCFKAPFKAGLITLLASLVIMQATLVAMPWWPLLLRQISPSHLLFFSSLGLTSASFLFIISIREADFNQFLI